MFSPRRSASSACSSGPTKCLPRRNGTGSRLGPKAGSQSNARAQREHAWRERRQGLRRWFLSTGGEPAQAEVLRARERSAIPQLLAAINALNERRAGRSDCSADFRLLAGWFADCSDDGEAHRLARAAFALNPARHLALLAEALAEQAGPDALVRRRTADGLMHISLQPLGPETQAAITTPQGVFAGRDHAITITPAQEAR